MESETELSKKLLEYYNEDYISLRDIMTPGNRTKTELAYITRMLNVVPGTKILDLGCGYGRIAHELAKTGAVVTGIDLVPSMIEIANKRAREDELSVDYILGDIAERHGLMNFDAAIMWFFSFGYGSERGNARTLKAAWSALKKGGFLLFDVYNTHLLARENHPSLVDKGDALFIHKPMPDLERGRWGVERIAVQDGSIRRSTFSCRCYTPPELREMIAAAGFRDVRFFGDDGQYYSPESPKLVVVALK